MVIVGNENTSYHTYCLWYNRRFGDERRVPDTERNLIGLENDILLTGKGF